MIGEQPFEGGCHDTVACPLPAVAVGSLGESGTLGAGAGVTGLLTFENAPAPTAFRAATLKRYSVPSFRPVIVWDVAVELNVIDGSAV